MGSPIRSEPLATRRTTEYEVVMLDGEQANGKREVVGSYRDLETALHVSKRMAKQLANVEIDVREVVRQSVMISRRTVFQINQLTNEEE